MRFLTILLTAAISAGTAYAAVLAHDNAADPAYADGYPQWDGGDQGGYGYTAWTLSPDPNQGDSGFFTGDSSQNGFSPSGNINSPGGSAWGLYANGTASAIAYRGFDFNGDTSLDDLPLFATFSLYMDNGWNDANVGFVLRNGNDTSSKNAGQLLEFLHTANNNYRIIDGNGAVDTGLGWTDGGLRIDLTLTGANTYSLALTPNGGMASVFNGTLGGVGGIQSVALYNEHAGNGGSFDLFFNEMNVSDLSSSSSVPEPTTVSYSLLAGLLLRALHRRRSRLTAGSRRAAS